jgi:exopolysaccharide production protein ExoQ
MSRSLYSRLYFLFIFAIASKVFESIFGEPIPSFLSSDTVHFLLTSILIIWTLVLVYPKYDRISEVLLSQKWLLVLYLFVLVSCSWSSDATSSLRLIVLQLVLLISSAYIALEFNPRQIIDLITNFTVILALGSIVGQFMLTTIVETALKGWVGIYGHKNYLGIGMAIGITCVLASDSKWTILRWCKLLLFVVILELSQSATAIVAAASVIGLIILRRLSRRAIFSLAFLLIFAVVSVIWTSNVDNLVGQLFGLIGRDSTFTGRNTTWYFISTQIMSHPLLGFGHEGFWIPHRDLVEGTLGWFPGHSHNGFLDYALNYGIPSLILLLAVLWGGIKTGFRVRMQLESVGTWFLLVMWLELLNNLTDVDYMAVQPLWLVFLVGLYSCWRLENLQESTVAESIAPLNVHRNDAPIRG